MKTSVPSFAAPASSTRFQRAVVAGVAAAGVVILLGFVRFPQITGSPLPYVALAFVAIMVVGLPAGLLLLATRTSTSPAELARSRSLFLGLVLGMIWIAYTLITHFIIPGGDQPTINAILLWGVLGVTTLALVVGSGAVAWESRQFTAGFTTGLATGFLTGVVAMLTIVLMLDAGMAVLVRHMNAQELAGFMTSGWVNRQAWYYWNEEFFGSIGDFVLLVLSGAVLGALGAGIGRLLAAVSRRSHNIQHEHV